MKNYNFYLIFVLLMCTSILARQRQCVKLTWTPGHERSHYMYRCTFSDGSFVDRRRRLLGTAG
jgi:hypothetical protein